jgi:predicted nuclease with TOPRIM domain
MSDPMFVMSMYANKTDLYEAKAKYYMEKSESLQAEVDQLKDSVFQYGIENTKLQIQREEQEATIAELKSFIDCVAENDSPDNYWMEDAIAAKLSETKGDE